MTNHVDRLLPDELWQCIQPLLPPPPARPRGGVLRHIPDRNCVAALAFMARTSTPWSLLPAKELGCGSATTCCAGWMSGPTPGCSTSCRRCCWTSSARPAASTWSESASTPSACGRSKGDLTGANPTDRGAGRLPPIRMPTGRLATPSRQGPCRQGLRSSSLPGLPAPARDPTADRPPHDRVLGPAGPPPLDDRAHLGLAGRMAAAADPL
jgi:transposase